MQRKITVDNVENILQEFDLFKSPHDRVTNKQKGELYLFVVGIDEYKKEKDLISCRDDANEFINIFWKKEKVKKKNTYSLIDHQATKKNIISSLFKLRQILNRDDSLIVYLAGYSIETKYSNFFVPHDGDIENYTSCISNSYITKEFMEFKSKSVIFFYNCLDFSYVDKKESFYSSLVPQRDSPNNEYPFQRASPLFEEIIKFLIEKTPNHVKGVFWFIKGSSVHSIKATSETYFKDNLRDYVSKKFLELKSIIKSNKTGQALTLLENILSNNDDDLLSRVETLKYKLGNISLLTAESSSEVELINRITLDILNRINENGFYLIQTAKDDDEILDQKLAKKIILFTSANPRDENFLRLSLEAKEIEYELMKAKCRDDFEFIKVSSLSIDKLQDALLNTPPNFLHFSGHGNCDGIALLNDYENTTLVKTKPLAQLLKLFSDSIQCVFLNSCYSIEQSKEISKHVNKVVCMSKKVPDNVAILFAAAFYKSIGSGKDIDFSFKFAKTSIELYNISGSDIPILLPPMPGSESLSI